MRHHPAQATENALKVEFNLGRRKVPEILRLQMAETSPRPLRSPAMEEYLGVSIRPKHIVPVSASISSK